MEPQIDRRALVAPRLPVDLLVELSHEGDDEVYEADAIDLGRGGIGLRAAVLPEVGQRLRCRFEVPGAGEPCEAAGEVVWAHDKGRWSGAFGVRFDVIDPGTADVLERIAPAPVEDPGTPPELRAPRTVKVKLDGVASPIEGELAGTGDVIAIEQAMPFLQIGRGAEIAGEGMRVRAVLDRVRLRVEDGVPRLVLELAPAAAAIESESESDAPRPGDATIQDEPLEEIVARAKPPVIATESAPAMEVRTTELREVAPKAIAKREDARVISREERAEASSGDVAREEPALAARMRELGERVRPKLVLAWSATRAFAIVLAHKAGPLALRARDAIVAAWRAVVAKIALRAPKLATMLGGAPKRRTTTAPPKPEAAAPRRARGQQQPAAEAPPNRRLRGIAIGAIAAAAVGLASYGLASGGEEEAPAVEVHREVSGGSWGATAASVVVPPAAPSAPAAAPGVLTTPETIEPIVVPEAAGAPVAPIEPRAMPEPAIEAGRIPAPSYPSLSDRTASAASAAPVAAIEPATAEPVAVAPAPAAAVMEFGAPSVDRGRTSTLRMSAPIQGLEGVADENGFTITVRGALSLDRASPISAQNPSVERAAILNRGDFSVLTIRFVEGRRPSYRVVARGTSLDVTIGR